MCQNVAKDLKGRERSGGDMISDANEGIRMSQKICEGDREGAEI